MKKQDRGAVRYRGLLLVCVVLGLIGGAAHSGDTVPPASGSFTNFRSEAIGYFGTETYYEGSTLLLTNCVSFQGTDTNSAVQPLDGVTIDVDVGNTATSITYVGTAISTNLGTWTATVIIPAGVASPVIQVKMTGVLTNMYIYPWKQLRTKAAL